MWTENHDPKKRIDDDALCRIIAGCGPKQIIFIDGPTGCGKTELMRRVDSRYKMRLPANLLTESLLFDSKIDYNYRLLHYLFSQLGLQTLLIEDVDVSFGGMNALQQLTADFLNLIRDRYGIVMTGWDIRQNCRVLLDGLSSENCLYFRYSGGAPTRSAL